MQLSRKLACATSILFNYIAFTTMPLASFADPIIGGSDANHLHRGKQILKASEKLNKASKGFRGTALQAKSDQKPVSKSPKFSLEATCNSDSNDHSPKPFITLDNDTLIPDLNKPAVMAHLNVCTPKIDFIREAQDIKQDSKFGEEQIGDGLIHAANCDCDQFNGRDVVDQLKKQGIMAFEDSEPGCLRLESGNILFSSKRNILVKLPEGAVQIAGGSIVLIMRHSDYLAVYDLHQGKVAAVKFISDKKLIELHPGLLMAMQKQMMDNFDSLNLASLDDIAYRNARRIDIGQVKGFLAEFSIPSVITKTLPLRQMLKSSNPKEHSEMDKMLNDSIALMEEASYLGPYHGSAQQ